MARRQGQEGQGAAGTEERRAGGTSAPSVPPALTNTTRWRRGHRAEQRVRGNERLSEGWWDTGALH